MAAYLASQMELGKLDYNTIVKSEKYSQYKDAIDGILLADGYYVNENGKVVKQL